MVPNTKTVSIYENNNFRKVTIEAPDVFAEKASWCFLPNHFLLYTGGATNGVQLNRVWLINMSNWMVFYQPPMIT